MGPRPGIGFDAHAFSAGRALVIGGVEIEHPQGLAGHSDADVLAHAVVDALLGAAGLGDIGTHFPPSDPELAGISGMELLRRTATMLASAGLVPLWVDSTVIAEAPRIGPYTAAMAGNMAAAAGIPRGHVSVKATTTDGLGFTGRGEGIAAMAVALVEEAR